MGFLTHATWLRESRISIVPQYLLSELQSKAFNLVIASPLHGRLKYDETDNDPV